MEFETSDSLLCQPLHPDLIHPADPTDTHPDFLQQGYLYNLNASAFDNILALSIPDLDNFNATHSFDLNRMPTSKPFMAENLCGPDIHSLPVSRASHTFGSSSSTLDHYLGPDISNHEDPQPSVVDNPSHRSNVRRLVEKATNTDQPERPRISTQFYKSIAPKMSKYESFTPSGIHTPSHSCNAHYVTWGTSNYTNLESSGMSNLMQNFAPQLSESNVFKSSDFFAPCYQLSSMANPKILKPPISHTEGLFVRDPLNPSGLGPNISNTDDVDIHMENKNSSTFGDNILDAPVLRPEEQITEQPVKYTGSMEAPPRRKRGRPRKGSIVLRPVLEPSQKKKRSKATSRNGVRKYHSMNSQRTNAKGGQHIDPSYRASGDNDAEVQDLMNTFTTINDKTGPYADEDSHVPDALELNAKYCSTCPSSAKDAGSEEIPQRRKTSRATNPNGARKPRSTNPRRANPKFWFFCIDPDCKASREKRTQGMPLYADIERHFSVHFAKRFRCTLPHTKGDHLFCRPDQLKE